MRKIVTALGVVPLVAGTAMAVQPLNDSQLNGVIAGSVAPTQPCDCGPITPVPTPTPIPAPMPTPTSTANEPRF